MIAIGTLKYKLEFYNLIENQSDTGYTTKTKSLLFQCKAAKVKEYGKYGVESKELFHSNFLTFKIRYTNKYDDNLIVKYSDFDYKIISSDINKFDNSIQIQIEKVNK